MPERLLDDQPRPAPVRPPDGDLPDERRDRARRHREVEDAVPLGAARLVDLAEQPRELVLRLVVREVERRVAHPAREPVPDLLAELVAGELAHGLLHPLAKRVVGLLRPGGADDREVLGQHVPEGERVQRGHQLPLRSGRPTRRR